MNTSLAAKIIIMSSETKYKIYDFFGFKSTAGLDLWKKHCLPEVYRFLNMQPSPTKYVCI